MELTGAKAGRARWGLEYTGMELSAGSEDTADIQENLDLLAVVGNTADELVVLDFQANQVLVDKKVIPAAQPGHLVVFLVDKKVILVVFLAAQQGHLVVFLVDKKVILVVFLAAQQGHLVVFLVDKKVILVASLAAQPGHLVVFSVDMMVIAVAPRGHEVWVGNEVAVKLVVMPDYRVVGSDHSVSCCGRAGEEAAARVEVVGCKEVEEVEGYMEEVVVVAVAAVVEEGCMEEVVEEGMEVEESCMDKLA